MRVKRFWLLLPVLLSALILIGALVEAQSVTERLRQLEAENRSEEQSITKIEQRLEGFNSVEIEKRFSKLEADVGALRSLVDTIKTIVVGVAVAVLAQLVIQVVRIVQVSKKE